MLKGAEESRMAFAEFTTAGSIARIKSEIAMASCSLANAIQ
jgi:hypothetical protein